MVDYVSLNRGSILRQMIAQYENELGIEQDRLASLVLKRTVLQFCREDLVEHGQATKALELSQTIQELDERIGHQRAFIARMENVLSDCGRKLNARLRAA